VEQARDRGLRVLIDLVLNHTSNEHPWFQAARADPESPYRDFYVWRDDDPGDTSDKSVFPGFQDGIWSYDEMAGAWYLHHFYDFQPDLNFANPAVRDEFRKIMGLWLQQGVDGFRIDAAPFLNTLVDFEPGQQFSRTHQYLEELRSFAAVRSGNAILLGEVDVSLSAIADYFGGGNELQSLFNFPLNRYLFLALQQGSADPIHFGLNELPTVPETGEWVNFLRHHDELNLSRLTKAQREQLFDAFAPDEKMRVYGRGIRRRLAPMLGNDQAWLRLAYSVLFSLPGAPLIFYGEEIGMGENLDLPERLSVRTPMPWTAYDNGGFSSAPPECYVRPLASDHDYGFQKVSVGKARGEPNSLLNWMASLMRVRKECGEIGAGTCSAVDTGTDAVLGLRHDVPDSTIVVFNNLSRERQTVTVDMDDVEIATATDLFTDRAYKPIESKTRRFRMDGLGYRWIRLRGIY
jgi:maltose alpha-D-glucosyltransferase/alpha-amylase